jgi:cyclopropane fatty-acyl-phospholipid synthase-like methyltransferase
LSIVSIVRRNTVNDQKEFLHRFDDCANEIIDFVGSVGFSYRGARVLDIGSGNGVIDLGVSLKSGADVVGVDIDPTDAEILKAAAHAHGLDYGNANLSFQGSDDKLSSLEIESFDHIYSRDVFEHVFDPVTLLRSANRVLKSGGTMFIQIWPLWDSEWGAHLFEGVRSWEHTVKGRDEILSRFNHPMVKISYDSCSRTSIDDLQRATLAAGFHPLRVELITNAFSPPEYAHHLPWNRMGIEGIKVLLRKP